jgi:hypothetical protein
MRTVWNPPRGQKETEREVVNLGTTICH